jgi:hypothetical protein
VLRVALGDLGVALNVDGEKICRVFLLDDTTIDGQYVVIDVALA